MAVLSTLSLGSVELNVKNLDLMKRFYRDILGFGIFDENNKNVSVGKNNNPLLILHKTTVPPSSPRGAGLYHFALLFSSRADLAKTLEHILLTSPESFSGSADHLVSEAFYFTDPEGNGIELYVDRDKSDWKWENNQIQMASLYLDPRDYIAKHKMVSKIHGDTTMGHVHLKVGDIYTARNFYVGILGFDITAELPGALFVSVGGYHHHIGLNMWESQGAGKRTDSLGLKQLSFILPTENDITMVHDRLKTHNIDTVSTSTEVSFPDPWNNTIILKANS